MERKKYLELCQKYAINKISKVVICDGIKYYPLAYVLAFNDDGSSRHSAVLQDTKSKSVTLALLSKVEEV